MATGSKSLSKRYSVFAGSLRQLPREWLDPRRCSEPQNLLCKLCQEAGNQVTATKYCSHCHRYMCTACIQGHKSTAKRVQSVPEGRWNNNNVHYGCLKHKHGVLEYFCESHNIMGCKVCVKDNHKHCKNVQHIPAIMPHHGGYDLTEQRGNLIENLQIVLRHAQKNKIGLSEKERLVSERRDREVNKATEMRKKMQELLEQVEGDMENQANKIKEEDIMRINQEAQEYDYITSNIENLIAELQQDSDGTGLFIAIKTAQTNMEHIQDKIAELEVENVVSVYNFEPASEVNKIISGQVCMGTIQKETTTRYNTDINIRSRKDKLMCWISGLLVWSEVYLIVVDHENSKIKMIKTGSNKIIAQLQTASPPWDITRIGSKYIAITLPDEKKIQYIKVGSKLSITTSIPVDSDCCAIEYADHKLYVTYTQPPKLQILDLKGNILRKIEIDQRRNKLFSHPYHIAVSHDQRLVYISDIDEHSVTCMTVDGCLVNTYKSYSLTGPLGVSTDRYGNVYVCGGWSKNLHCLKKDCSEGREVLCNIKNPQAVAVSQDQRHLLISKVASNRVTVYEND